ncbi:MAG: flagellar hook-associated protein FlgK [Rhodospirillum sp.]|nr:flagellar hook-associated protein FlgK [Rhodospirillum sp.]MCF8491692.1 flagellar hook-associated protein FlgK [Rhodospirillum sp.]
MSISGIIHTGTSGLLASQTRIAVTSTNITNADTTGYTTKSAYQATTVVGGVGTGVTIVGIGNSVDKALMSEIMEATSSASYESTLYTYLNSVLNSLGSTSDGSAMEETMTELMSVLSDAITAGGDSSSLDDVLTALDSWTSTLNSASDAVQSAREAADEAIGETVDSINSILQELDDLNEQITRNAAMGSSTSDLEDSQRVLLEELSSYTDINYFTTSTGELQVYTDSGTALLTSSAKELEYTPVGGLTADITYDAGSGTGISGITINGVDVTSKLSGGSLGALIQTRDEDLPAIQDALDELATTIAETLNAVSNSYSAAPAPNSLTSDGAVTATDAFSGTGTLTVLTVDEDGTVTGSQDIDLSTMTTYQDVIDALDGVTGVSASLDGDGNLVISADDADSGVVLTGDGTVDSDGRGFSHHFGFNNVVSGTGAEDLAVTATLAEQGIPVATVATTTVGETALESGDTTGLQALWTALDDPMTFDAAGVMTSTEKSAIGQIAALIDEVADLTTAASDATDTAESLRDELTETFDNTYGVNVDEETAKLVSYEQSYQMASQVIVTARDMFDTLLGMVN